MSAAAGNGDVIATARLDLVPLLPEHAGEMAAVLADPALYAFTGGTPPTAEELRDRYERWAAGAPEPAVTWYNWAILIRRDGRLAGTVQATVTSSADAGMSAELAWVVGTFWQGHGIATEAAEGAASWLRGRGVRTLTAYIHPAHHASAAVATAIGLAPTSEVYDGEVAWRLDTGEG